jgi:hypothetical protein
MHGQEKVVGARSRKVSSWTVQHSGVREALMAVSIDQPSMGTRMVPTSVRLGRFQGPALAIVYCLL